MSEKIWSAKDPGELKDYVFDWTQVLNGDTISTSTWSVVSGNATISTTSQTATTTTVWMSGGIAKSTTLLRNVIVTAGGRTYNRTRALKILSL